ncbi:RNA-directed DNA polymerase, eukaryota, reverse transcriptase zinc-binding domain protein [Tanacetum coccineum]
MEVEISCGKNSLWRNVIKEFYGGDGGFDSSASTIGTDGIWYNIIKATNKVNDLVSSFKNSFVIKVLNGQDTQFWLDPWCNDGVRLSDAFLRLFAHEQYKGCKVADRWHLINNLWGGNWSWRLPPRRRANDDLSAMINFIDNLVLSLNGPDRWEWDCNNSGLFRTKTLCKNIQVALLNHASMSNPHKWNSWIPRKVNIFVWRAACDRLPTRINLLLRGVTLPSSSCPICNLDKETIDHCIVHCSRISQLWRKVWAWWNLDPSLIFPSFSIGDWASGNIASLGCPRIKKIMHGVFCCAIWCIWKWRNKIVNAEQSEVARIMDEDLFPAIQRISKTWISARCKERDTNWSCWTQRPFDIFASI